jgi:sugar lactone lactonase YvrE
MKAAALRLKDRHFDNWTSEVEDRWNYADIVAHEEWRKDWISFDSLCYVEKRDTVFCGITSLSADIFWGYDRGSRRFVPTGFEKIADPYDAKFHRSLVEYDGCLYAGIALLHDIDRYWEAPGGAIVRYDLTDGTIEKIGIPIPHVYIQSIALDERRGLLYGQTFTPERLFSFDLETRRSRDIGPIGSGLALAQGENLVLDDDGNVWGAWSVTRAWQSSPGKDGLRLFRCSPEKGAIDYLTTGLPRPDGSYGYEKVEGLFNFGTGCLYASGGNGSLHRIEPKAGRAEYLFTPISDRPSRLASMTLAPDGFAYGVTGRAGRTELLRFDPKKETYDLLGEVKDENGVTCWQVHDVVSLPGGTLYAAENDCPTRSGYLWEIAL